METRMSPIFPIGALCIVLALYICTSLSSFPQNLHDVQFLSIEQGLSQSWVRCLFQDSTGYIWIGTQDGLNRYDGYDFRHFRHQVYDSTSIIGNTINSICEDRNGDLWIGTENGLCRFNRRETNFTSFQYRQNDSSYRGTGPVSRVVAGRLGYIWYTTRDRLTRIDPETETFTTFRLPVQIPLSRPLDYISPVMEDRQGNIWTGTHDGLLLFHPERETFLNFTMGYRRDGNISSNIIRAIYEDHLRQIWIGTDNGLNRYNPSDSTFHTYFINKAGEVNIPILGLFSNPTGAFWIGTGSGIFHFDTLSGNFTEWEKIEAVDYGGKLLSFSAFIKDRSEIIWIGGSQGMVKYDQKKKKFTLYRNLSNGNPGFSSSMVTAIYEDRDRMLWIGTWGGGLNFFDRKTNHVTVYRAEHDNPAYRISNNVVSCVFEDSRGSVWVGTERGVNIYHPGTKEFQSFCEYSSLEPCSIIDRLYINHITEDHEGNIWFGTSEGLVEYSPRDGLIRRYSHLPDDPYSISNDFVYYIHGDGIFLWLGTRKGLNRFDPSNGRVISYQADNTTFPGSISSNFVYFIHEDPDGILWLATESGLNRFHKETEQFTVYTVREGLPNDMIYAVLEDEKQNLWISTNRGLVLFNLHSHVINTFDVTDGIQSLEFNIGAYHKSRRGEFFFGGVSGFNSFYPDLIQNNPHLPEVVITSFQYLSEEGWIEIPVGGREVTIRTRETNMFAVEFAALEFTNPERNLYAFYLEGLENSWQPQTTSRRAVYSNLNPGVYTFRVKGSNDDHVWNDQGTSLTITIRSPVWSSRGAYIFYYSAIILLIYLFIQYRTLSLRRANKILKEKQRASLEIERQREELSVKNKNITDSINYAKKIQEAMLPSASFFRKMFPESFILYRPKDIVSGDFYWINEKNEKVFVTAVDCTGHGVPGAFMSLIGFEILAKIINDQGIDQPAEILNILSTAIEDTFSKGEEDLTLKDGMDLAFCVIDRKEKILQFAGAFNPLYLLRDKTLTEIRGDRMSVGISEGPGKTAFTNHVVPLEEEDVIYLFSDGYADQFGGPDGKKFMYRRFRHLLLTIHTLDMEDQLAFLEESMESWMGNQDQIDDILIIGIRPLTGVKYSGSG